MKKCMKLIALSIISVMLLTLGLTGCGSSKEQILIYTSVEDYVVEDLSAQLDAQFPDYDITVEYVSRRISLIPSLSVVWSFSSSECIA